ncbi:hypothetical protein C4J81_04695 [Deltaproteobacteria bacterium Smac51]|nr:hypothetical protein C4J81_04695 [Deltaproteobacteria bacterium Smac51]
MQNLLVTIVGRDRPGIIYQVSRILADRHCNVIEVSQTTLMDEFAGLFSCAMPRGTDPDELDRVLGEALAGSGLGHWVKAGTIDNAPAMLRDRLEPYVVTLRGPDRLGIIPEFSGIMAGFEVNINNLRAVSMTGGQDGNSPQVVLFFELSVPREVKQGAFRQALNMAAEEMGMEMSLQHRDIFEAIHRL